MLTTRLLMVVGLATAATATACTPYAAPARTLEDLSFTALVDQDGDGHSADDPSVTIHLDDYLAANRPGTKILMIGAAAGWCEPCMREAGELPAFTAAYAPRGVVVLSAVFEDQNGSACDETFARLWAQTFALSNPILVDSTFAMGRWFDAHTMPASLFVDAATGEILDTVTGADSGA